MGGSSAKYTSEDTCFNTPDDILKAIKEIGVTMLTTGNNHALDRGKPGLKRTIDILDEYGFDHTGTAKTPDSKRYVVKEIKGVRVAFLSYSYGTNSFINECLLSKEEEYMVNLTRPQDQPPYRSTIKRVAKSTFLLLPKAIRELVRPEASAGIISDCVSSTEIDNPRNEHFVKRMLDDVKEAKKGADIVVFCLHSGGQFNSEVTGYTRWLIDILVEAGVDAVVCNHTHTPLPIEERGNGCVVAYSLGNFSFTPGVGYYVPGVNAEYSKVLHLIIDTKKKCIVNHEVDMTKCEVDSKGYAYVSIIS